MIIKVKSKMYWTIHTEIKTTCNPPLLLLLFIIFISSKTGVVVWSLWHWTLNIFLHISDCKTCDVVIHACYFSSRRPGIEHPSPVQSTALSISKRKSKKQKSVKKIRWFSRLFYSKNQSVILFYRGILFQL